VGTSGAGQIFSATSIGTINVGGSLTVKGATVNGFIKAGTGIGSITAGSGLSALVQTTLGNIGPIQVQAGDFQGTVDSVRGNTGPIVVISRKDPGVSCCDWWTRRGGPSG
jgi:hypothetical protein